MKTRDILALTVFVTVAAPIMGLVTQRALLQEKTVAVPAATDNAAVPDVGNEGDVNVDDRGRPLTASDCYKRGRALDERKQFEDALAAYNQAIALRPGYYEAYKHRGVTYQNLKQYDKATADYTRAIEFDPKNKDLFYNRGTVYLDSKQYLKAAADYRTYLALAPCAGNAEAVRGYIEWLDNQPSL